MNTLRIKTKSKSGSNKKTFSKNRYFKFFEEPDRIYLYSDKRGSIYESEIQIDTNGGFLEDPNIDQYFKDKNVGLYYCGLESVLYYYTYGTYVAEVFPIKHMYRKTRHDESVTCYASPVIHYSSVKRYDEQFLIDMIELGAPIAFYRKETDDWISPLYDDIISTISSSYGGKKMYTKLANSVLKAYYKQFPSVVVSDIMRIFCSPDDKRVVPLLSEIMSVKIDIGVGMFSIINSIDIYYRSTVKHLKNKKELDRAMIPVEWMLFWLRKQYPHVFAITIGQFPYFNNIEQKWRETQYRTPDGFMHIV